MISKLLRSLLPAGIKELLMKMDIVVYLKRQLFKYEVKRVRKQQPAILKAIQGKENINVIFLAIHDTVWKYEELYRFLQKDNRFTVEIVVVPLVRNGIATVQAGAGVVLDSDPDGEVQETCNKASAVIRACLAVSGPNAKIETQAEKLKRSKESWVKW